jgi:hypothetical protein
MLADLLRVDVVGGDGQLAGVIQQVVEQDLGGQRRQEGQEYRRPGAGYPPLADASGSYALQR